MVARAESSAGDARASRLVGAQERTATLTRRVTGFAGRRSSPAPSVIASNFWVALAPWLLAAGVTVRAPPRFLITIATAAMARTSIVACGLSEYDKFVHRSGHPEPMPSLRDG
jgi:hypothetical protein